MIKGPYKVPQGWRWAQLGEVCETKMGGTPSTKVIEYWEPGEVVWITPEDLEKTALNRVASSRRFISRVGLGKSSAKLFPPKTVLVSTTATIGKIAIAEISLSANQQISGIICGDSVCPEFLAYYLLKIGEVGLRERGGTATATHINQTSLRSLPIPLPPLEEQRRIVARIEELMPRVREAKRLRQQAQEDAARLWQSVLAETFPRPGSELPPGWRWVRLGEVCQHRTGIWGPEASDPAQGFPIVRSTEIDGFLIRAQAASVRVVRAGQVDAYKLETGDMLVSKSSGSPHLVGWPAIFEDPQDGRTYLFSNFMLRLRSDRCSLEPRFLLHYLHSPIARSIYLGAQDTTSGLRNLRVQEFMAQPTPLPPLEEQRRIVAYLEAVQEKVKALKEAQAATDAELQRLEQAILDRAFRGEL